MKKQLGFFIDSSICSGCKTCQVACKDKNELDIGIRYRRIYEVAGGDWIKAGNGWRTTVFAYNVSISCNHCAEPACVKACPTKAHKKLKNGVVVIDQKKCVGCRYCEWACPYGAPQYDTTSGTMTKCDLCLDKIKIGEESTCVSACPMRGIQVGYMDQLKKKFSGLSELEPLPPSNYTKPSLIIKPHKDARPSKGDKSLIKNREEV